MTSMTVCVMMLLASTAHATGKPNLAQIEAHGAIVGQHKKQKSVYPTLNQNMTAADKKALELLDVVYSGHSLHAFWKAGDYKGAMSELVGYNLPGEAAQAVLYAEVKPMSFVQLLHRAGAKPGMKYYDLGSGTGKTVFLAYLLGLDATGVELVGTRFNTACKAVKTAESAGMKKKVEGGGVQFSHGSFLDLDFSDADIIFTDSAFFTDDMMLRMGHMAKKLKLGAKIITTKPFPGEGINLVETVLGQTSRSTGTPWTIQIRSDEAAPKQDDAVLPVERPQVQPASLIRQELPAGTHQVKDQAELQEISERQRGFGPKSEGPIIGAFELPAEAPPTQEKTCSLKEEQEPHKNKLEGKLLKAMRHEKK